MLMACSSVLNGPSVFGKDVKECSQIGSMVRLHFGVGCGIGIAVFGHCHTQDLKPLFGLHGCSCTSQSYL